MRQMSAIRIVGLVLSAGLVLAACSGGDDGSGGDVTPTPEATNPQTIRGTATINRNSASFSGGFFEANLYEAAAGQARESAVVVDSVTREDISHSQQLPTQWDFRLTAPNFNPENRYYVFGRVLQNQGDEQPLLVGACEQEPDQRLCSVLGGEI